MHDFILYILFNIHQFQGQTKKFRNFDKHLPWEMLIICENIWYYASWGTFLWSSRSYIVYTKYNSVSTVKVLAPREQAILFSHRWATRLPTSPRIISDRPLVYSNKYYLISQTHKVFSSATFLSADNRTC